MMDAGRISDFCWRLSAEPPGIAGLAAERTTGIGPGAAACVEGRGTSAASSGSR